MPSPFRPFRSQTELTPSIREANDLLSLEKLEEALAAFDAEPPESTCYDLALGNAGLVCRRLGRYADAEARLVAWSQRYRPNRDCHPPSSVQFIRNLGEAVSRQERRVEALDILKEACMLADQLAQAYPDFQESLELEKAHTLISMGSTLLPLSAHDAVTHLQKARDLFRRFPTGQRIGHAEVLSNLALAYEQLGKMTQAELASREALEIAMGENNQDEVDRIRLNFSRMDAQAGEDSIAAFRSSIDEAQRQGRYETAYIRSGQLAQFLESIDDVGGGVSVLNSARLLEPMLDPQSPYPPQLRRWQAFLEEKNGAAPPRVTDLLTDAAALWCKLLTGPPDPNDFGLLAEAAHDDFRVLAEHLVRQSRYAEALVAVEFSRAVLHAALLDRKALQALLESSPFVNGSSIDCEAVRKVQAALLPGESVVTLVILPSNDAVAFVITQIEVQIVCEPLGANEWQEYTVAAARLQEGTGVLALPKSARLLGVQIRKALGTGLVRAIVPYGILHNIPWRVLLRANGMTWEQLRCQVELGILLRTVPHHCPHSVIRAVALGYGGVRSGNEFIEEATVFAAEFGAHGRVDYPTRSSVRRELSSQSEVMLLSCHGRTNSSPYGPQQLFLELADGACPADEVVPPAAGIHTVILSACHSAIYDVSHGQFPIGLAPELLRSGVWHVIGGRFELNADFARSFMTSFGKLLAAGVPVIDGFAEVCEELEAEGRDLWRDLGGLEITGRA